MITPVPYLDYETVYGRPSTREGFEHLLGDFATPDLARLCALLNVLLFHGQPTIDRGLHDQLVSQLVTKKVQREMDRRGWFFFHVSSYFSYLRRHSVSCQTATNGPK